MFFFVVTLPLWRSTSAGCPRGLSTVGMVSPACFARFGSAVSLALRYYTSNFSFTEDIVKFYVEEAASEIIS
jgi:hypothetical protein